MVARFSFGEGGGLLDYVDYKQKIEAEYNLVEQVRAIVVRVVRSPTLFPTVA
jgi:hypothetical protein